MTEKNEIRVILPIPHKSLHPNYKSWSRGGAINKAKQTKKQRHATRDQILNSFPQDLPWSKCEVLVTLYHKVRRARDTDNAMASLKSMYDGIQDAGVVHNDTPEHMTRREPVFAIDKNQPRTEVIIKRVL